MSAAMIVAAATMIAAAIISTAAAIALGLLVIILSLLLRAAVMSPATAIGPALEAGSRCRLPLLLRATVEVHEAATLTLRTSLGRRIAGLDIPLLEIPPGIGPVLEPAIAKVAVVGATVLEPAIAKAAIAEIPVVEVAIPEIAVIRPGK